MRDRWRVMRRAKQHLYIATLIALALSAVSVAAQSSVTTSDVIVEAYRATNVRSGPSVNYDVIAYLQPGDSARAVGRSDQYSNWLQIELGNQLGWVAYFTVSVSGDPSSLEIVFAPDPEPDVTAEALPSEVPNQQATSNLYVTAYRRVNVRSGPGTEFNTIGVLTPGQTADIIGTSGEDNEWLQIRYNGEDGWVAYFVVTVSGDVSILERFREAGNDLAANTVAGGIIQNQVIVITLYNTNLRAEPRFGSDVVTVIPYDTTLRAIARTEDNNWLQVEYEGVQGWLTASLVSMGASDVDDLPVALIPTATPQPQG